MKAFGVHAVTFYAISQLFNIVQIARCLEVEPKESSILVQENNIEEFRQLRDLLGMPVGDAKTANATKGMRKTTRFVPKCPEKLADAPLKSREIVLKRCPRLRHKEYSKQEKKVAEIILKSGKRTKNTYEDEKRALIVAVNHLAKLAGPLPSI